jgi:hypothetical protein
MTLDRHHGGGGVCRPGPLNSVVALVIACVKALLVVLSSGT